MRIRLGACLTEEPILCERCGTSVLDKTASHALCCDGPGATRGHTDVRNEVFNLVQLADHAATKETLGLIPPRPELRPADIYAEAALPGSRAALDTGICFPEASNAGLDCCESMWKKKCDTYREHFAELAGQGIW